MHHPNKAQLRRGFVLSALLTLFTAASAMPAAAVTLPSQYATVAVAQATQLRAADTVLGPMAASQKLHVVIGLKLRNGTQLNAFIARATDKATPQAQRRLPDGAFLANYSPTAAQASAVADFLRAKGFTDIHIAPNRLLVSANATSVVAQSAFATTLRRVQTARGEAAYANIAPIRIPTSLQGVVQSVLGLQNVYHPRTMMRRADTYSASGHNPTEFPHIYGAESLPEASDVSVGIITAGDMSPVLSDLNAFISQNNLPNIDVHVVNTGSGSSDTSGTGEWDLDSQTILGMAGNLKHMVFYASDTMSFAGLTEAMNAAVNDTTYAPQVVNMSFGGCEGNGQGTQTEANVFAAAVAKGMTFSASSGDSGADCDRPPTTFGVADPASQPNVVAVGGTLVSTNNNNDYLSESAWSGSGGGLSTFEPIPSWQKSVVSGQHRAIPDIAFDASPNSGAVVIVNGSTSQIGGTSLASPIFVGAWARILQSNPGLTFAAPYFYNTLSAVDFNDVTTGNNATNESNGQYPAGAGYDMVTGLGSLKVAQVSADLGQPGPPSLAKHFAPNQIAADGTSTLTITLSNATQPTNAATLQSALVDTLPAGVVVAATPHAATTCTGNVSASAGAQSVSLSSGSSIAAGSTCTISVDVTAAGNGTYVNTIAAGALHTDLGDNVAVANATLTVGNGMSDPVAQVSPGSLQLSAASGAAANGSLSVANIGGGNLSYSFAEASVNAAPVFTTHEAHNYSLDDGSMEQADALSDGSKEYAAIWLNRFAAVGPMTITSVSIYWPDQTSAGGSLSGKQPRLLVYYDADGDGKPGNAVVLSNTQVSISQMGAFQDYSVNVSVPAAGDVYIGFADSWANGGATPYLKPVAEDTSANQERSYIAYNGDGSAPDLATLSNNGEAGVITSNLMIRASGSSTYNSANCSAPGDITWLSETPASGSVLGGHDANVTITANAGTMADGNYSAMLCATTNDAAHSLIVVPVSFSVSSSGTPVNQPPQASFTDAVNDLTVNFTDSSSDSDGSIVSWVWDFGDSSTVTAQNPSHVYAAAGTYTVTLTVTDDQGASDAYSVQVTVTAAPVGTPVAVVTPIALTDSLQAGAADSQTLTIGNTGSADLTYNIAEAAPQQVVLGINSKANMLSRSTQLHAVGNQVSSMALPAPVLWPVASTHASLSFALDDGTYESRVGLGDSGTNTESAAVYLNRFTPAAGSGAFTIDSVSVTWPNQGTAGSIVGLSARIVAYYDADGDGDPTNASFLGESAVTIASVDSAQTYNVSFDVPGAGDIYVGFEDQWAEGGYTPRLRPGALDTTASQARSYLYGNSNGSAPDYHNLANDDLGGTLDSLGAAGNLAIRATGTTQGGPTGSCANPTDVPWLNVNPLNGTVAVAASAAVTVGFDATGMSAGHYTALLCLATNDPNQSTIEVPVSMDVTACSSTPDDAIFIDGFEPASTACGGGGSQNPNVVSGTINQPVPNSFDGAVFNFVTGAYTLTMSATDDINLWASGGKLSVFWPTTSESTAHVGCVSDTSGKCTVMHAGESVGTPGQSFSSTTSNMTNWLSGADGYIGVAFWNETTSELDYGYLHLTTTAANGFPAQMLDYAYDKSGAAITIP